MKHFNRVLFRALPSEANKVNDGAKSARLIEAEFNKLSEFKLRAIGTEATTCYVENLNPSSPDLDFEVLDAKGTRIAQLDTTGSNFTFKGSKIMPVRDYKGIKVKTLPVPCYFVYWMKNEIGFIKDCCYWIRGEDVIKAPIKPLKTKEKWQKNYLTDKEFWHKSLESLVTELRKISTKDE